MWKRLKTFVWEWRGVLITAPTVASLSIALRLSGSLQLLEWATLDRFFRWRPPEAIDSRIVIVEISESDIQKIGQWPIPDAVMAQLIEKLKQQQPRAIGLDIYRDLRVEPGHQKLVKVFKTTPNLIGVKTVAGGGKGIAVNPPPVLARLGQVGANNLQIDADGKVRRGLLFLQTKDGKVVPTLALKLAFLYLKHEGIIPQNSTVNPEYLQLNKAIFTRMKPLDGGYVLNSAAGYQIIMNFRRPNKSFRIVSINDVLSNRTPPDLMRDRIVLIGSRAISLPDLFNTPYDNGLASTFRTSGVEIHANLTSQIVGAAVDGRPLIKVWSEPLEWMWIFAWSIVGVALGCLGRSLPGKYHFYSDYWTVISIVIIGISLFGGTYLAFLSGWWIPVVPAILSLVGSALAITGYIARIERQEYQTLMKLFERNVTPKIAAAIWRVRCKLLDSGQLIPQEMTATVLFTDLKGFSSISEGVEPKKLMSWLNEYMQAMAQVVLEYDGVIDKFIGDAIMAVFGVPIPSTTEEKVAEDAQNAIICALKMAEVLKSLNQQWQIQGKPTVSMRVGIATGILVAGSLGSDRRQDYTVIGDTVNIASRLESYDKSIDGGVCRILISEETWKYTQDKSIAKLVGSVLLKGREQPVNVYQVFVE